MQLISLSLSVCVCVLSLSLNNENTVLRPYDCSIEYYRVQHYTLFHILYYFLTLRCAACSMQYTSIEHSLNSGGVSPFSKHSFSQAASWSGGGVMKMILSLDTPIDSRYLTISFKFSVNSWRGTCCAGFLSGKERLKVSHSITAAGV